MNVYQYIVSYFDFDVDWETLYLGHALNLFPLVIKIIINLIITIIELSNLIGYQLSWFQH